MSEFRCGKCGKDMVFNVPRMGAAGGFVHEDTGKLLCADEEKELLDLGALPEFVDVKCAICGNPFKCSRLRKTEICDTCRPKK